MKPQPLSEFTQPYVEGPDGRVKEHFAKWLQYANKIVRAFTGSVGTAPAAPPSTVPITNTTGQFVLVYIYGGNFSQINVNGILVPTPDKTATIPLAPGDTLAITYTVAPSMIWKPVGI